MQGENRSVFRIKMCRGAERDELFTLAYMQEFGLGTPFHGDE